MKERSSNRISTFNILQLQNLVKRDPESYYEEFRTQYEHYQSLLGLFKFNPAESSDNLVDLVRFLAQVSPCYKEDLQDFPQELMRILDKHGTVLDPTMRMCFVKALILMRNKGVIEPIDVITLFFELLRCNDKVLRKYIEIHIVADVKNINAKHKNVKVNSALQNFMFKMLADNSGTAAKVSLDIMIELYRRNVWRDDKTVNAISTACLSKENKVLVAALKFFLGVDDEDENKESDSEDDNTPSVRDVIAVSRINKSTRKRKKLLERTKKVVKKAKKKKEKESFNFAAIHLLNDPQGLAEKLFARLQEKNERFEIKMLIMNFISRLIGVHELVLMNVYPYLLRFMKPRQREVTKILMFAAQSIHEYVPPDAVHLLIKEILNNFVSETNSSEVITVGINSIREICVRCPTAIDQELLQDLALYKKYKNKNVQMAARSLIHLFRKINPLLLHRKDRCRPTVEMKEKQEKNLEYGASNAKTFVPGTEILSLHPSADAQAVEDEEAADSDGSWIDVSHSEDDSSSAEEESEDEDACEAKDENVVKDESKTSNSQADAVGEQQTEDKNEAQPQEFKDEKEKAEAISHSRILSQEDFKKIKIAQLAKEVQYAKGKKRKSEVLLSEPTVGRSEIVSLKDIEKLHKRPKPDKETRLQTVMEGREGRENFAKKKKTKSPHASKTNKQHNKNKAFMMIKHKVRSKVKRSFKDKQVALQKALLRRRRH